MSLERLLDEARRYGARFTTEGGRVVVEAPAPLPESLIAELRMHKAEVMAIQEAFEERAAILEFDAGLRHDDAELEAWALVLRKRLLH